MCHIPALRASKEPDTPERILPLQPGGITGGGIGVEGRSLKPEWGMASISDMRSIPTSKSHIMISLCKITDQQTRTINEKSDAHKSTSILKKVSRE